VTGDAFDNLTELISNDPEDATRMLMQAAGAIIQADGSISFDVEIAGPRVLTARVVGLMREFACLQLLEGNVEAATGFARLALDIEQRRDGLD
jgi:hypothetical protein